MEISSSTWKSYIQKLRKVNDKAADLIRQYIEKNGFPSSKAEVGKLINFAYSVSTQYGEAAATLAAEMYEASAMISGKLIAPALPAMPPEIDEVARSVVGTISNNNISLVANAIARLVKRTAEDTTLENAIRDGAEFAWIPSGDTCAFCIMLASNGWQRAGKKALKKGHAEHIHANCDCTYMARFDSSVSVAGYDPDEYLQIYENAPGSTWEEKLNSMRREKYEKNKDEINAQKRAAYLEKKNASTQDGQ